MKKKKAKIICAVLVLLLLLLAGFLYLQRDNLRAIKEGMDSSVAELEECMDENEQKLEDALSGISMRDLTEEEKAALREGTLSREDLEKLLVGEDVGEEEKAYARSLADLLARVYALRVQYVTALENMEAEAKAEYSALPQGDRAKTKLVKIAKGYISKANALEKECDGKMDAIVEEMTEIIEENKGGWDILDAVVETYASEKSLKKAWYISRMRERGLI